MCWRIWLTDFSLSVLHFDVSILRLIISKSVLWFFWILTLGFFWILTQFILKYINCFRVIFFNLYIILNFNLASQIIFQNIWKVWKNFKKLIFWFNIKIHIDIGLKNCASIKAIVNSYVIIMCSQSIYFIYHKTNKVNQYRYLFFDFWGFL